MDVQELIGHNVTHKSFGTGRILSVTDTWIEVEFVMKGTKKVQFPQTFASYMRIDDEYLQSQIMVLEEKRKTDEIRQKQIEAEKRAHVQARYEMKNHSNARKESDGDWLKSKADRTGVAETKAETYYYGERIIGPKTSFATHADVLNACFGFNYKHFQKAYKDLENLARAVDEKIKTFSTMGDKNKCLDFYRNKADDKAFQVKNGWSYVELHQRMKVNKDIKESYSIGRNIWLGMTTVSLTTEIVFFAW